MTFDFSSIQERLKKESDRRTPGYTDTSEYTMALLDRNNAVFSMAIAMKAIEILKASNNYRQVKEFRDHMDDKSYFLSYPIQRDLSQEVDEGNYERYKNNLLSKLGAWVKSLQQELAKSEQAMNLAYAKYKERKEALSAKKKLNVGDRVVFVSSSKSPFDGHIDDDFWVKRIQGDYAWVTNDVEEAKVPIKDIKAKNSSVCNSTNLIVRKAMNAVAMNLEEAHRFKPGEAVVLEDGSMGTIIKRYLYAGYPCYKVKMSDGSVEDRIQFDEIKGAHNSIINASSSEVKSQVGRWVSITSRIVASIKSKASAKIEENTGFLRDVRSDIEKSKNNLTEEEYKEYISKIDAQMKRLESVNRSIQSL